MTTRDEDIRLRRGRFDSWWDVLIDGVVVGFVVRDAGPQWSAWLYRRERNWKLDAFPTRREAVDEVRINRYDAEPDALT